MTDIKTAEQINSQVLGKVDLHPKILETLLKQAQQPISREKAPGCWDVCGLSGARAAVMKAVQAHATCPQADKDWICSHIAALPERFNHVAVHGYMHIEKEVRTVDITILPSIQLM